MVNKVKIEIESNHILHEVIIMEAIQQYMKDRGFFCWVRVKKIEDKELIND